jgi:hypothetical protein
LPHAAIGGHIDVKIIFFSAAATKSQQARCVLQDES